MNNLVEKKIESYPINAKNVFDQIRTLIFEAATELQLTEIEETLKWGEPAYLVKGGSTIRVDWKAKSSDKIIIYFNCKTLLVETFKEVYFDVFQFQGNRGLEIILNKPMPKQELKDCLFMALQYHKIKHLPLLGA